MTLSTDYRQSAYWLLAACAMGFLVPAVFSMILEWQRAIYLLPLTLIIGTFSAIYLRRFPISLKDLFGTWTWGIVVFLIASVFLLTNVFGQPASPALEGPELIGAILWMGIVYGTLDGLFLNVLPVRMVRHGLKLNDDAPRASRLLRATVALSASLLVTAAYHLGYSEFQNTSLFFVLLGNAIITLTYLISGSPFAAILTHVVMHVGAVLHGMETTLQLPPHYGP